MPPGPESGAVSVPMLTRVRLPMAATAALAANSTDKEQHEEKVGCDRTRVEQYAQRDRDEKERCEEKREHSLPEVAYAERLNIAEVVQEEIEA